MSVNNNTESQDCQQHQQQQQQQQQPGATSTGAEAAVSPVSRLRAQLRDLAASLPEDPELLRWVQATSVCPVTTPPQQYFSPGDRGDLVTPHSSLSISGEPGPVRAAVPPERGVEADSEDRRAAHLAPAPRHPQVDTYL